MKLPSEVQNMIDILNKRGYEAYAVGGSVRDFLMGKDGQPKDWDIATNAKPEEIQKVFPNSFYTNKFGTVTVKIKEQNISEVEITTYRVDEKSG